MTYQFSPARFQRSMRIIGYSAAILVSLCATVLLAGGQEFFQPEKIQPFYFEDETTIDDGTNTIFLFPGKSNAAIAGFLYVIFFALALFLIAMMLPWSIWRVACEYKEIGAIEILSKNHPLVALALLPFSPLLLHLAANLHWQFYCAVGVIDSFNCFWVFDGRSLLIGFAGLIGLALCALALAFIAFVGYQLYRLACYLSCLERVEKPTRVKSMNV